VGAGAIRGHARGHHPLAGLDQVDRVPDLGDHAGELVAEHGRRVEPGRHAVQREQVGAADRGGRHPDDGVPRIAQPRLGDVGHRRHPRLPDPDRFHAGCSISTR